MCVIKSECFIERRLRPCFLLGSTKSAVFLNVGSVLMWLMRPRCGSAQHTQFLSADKRKVTGLLRGKKRSVVHETPFSNVTDSSCYIKQHLSLGNDGKAQYQIHTVSSWDINISAVTHKNWNWWKCRAFLSCVEIIISNFFLSNVIPGLIYVGLDRNYCENGLNGSHFTNPNIFYEKIR